MSHHEDHTFHHEKTFDYIVVGTGPAGSIIANKLSAEGRNSVLVLEAGANNDNDKAIYSGEGTYGLYPEYYWTELIKAQTELPGSLFPLGGGRLAGGGSSVNSEIYIRPTPYVLKKWVKAGGEQWSPENTTQTFMTLENFNGGFAEQDIHGYEGPLPIRQVHQGIPHFLERLGLALQEGTGYDLINDYNDPRTPLGPYFRAQLYQKPNYRRASASVVFLGEGVTSDSGSGINGYDLQVLYEATATRVLFNDNKEAKQVEYLHKGVCWRAEAHKGVILSAGLRSAKLLMLSGIGDKSMLDSLGIPVLFDNKEVGRNLINDATVLSMVHVGKAAVDDVAGEHATMQCGAFLPDPLSDAKKNHRAIQIITNTSGEMMMMIMLLVDTKSRGSVSLQSADPLKALLVDEGFLTKKADLERLKAGLRSYIKPTADALAKFDSQYKLIGLDDDVLGDDDKLEQYIKQHFSQGYHEQGACRMGKLEEGAVVDGWGNVYGVRNLTVADTSIIPHHMDGNTSGAAYLIGATVAEYLLGNKEMKQRGTSALRSTC